MTRATATEATRAASWAVRGLRQASSTWASIAMPGLVDLSSCGLPTMAPRPPFCSTCGVVDRRRHARCGDPAAASTLIGGLAYDPAQPDHVFVGFSGVPSLDSIEAIGSVLASLDGGASWLSVGCQDVGPVHDLALGIDGRNLYASTDTGLWRLALDDLADSNTLPTC